MLEPIASNEGILTLAQFRKMTENLPDETQIVVADEEWYLNISATYLPDNDAYFAITFATSNDFDARQF
jgi:hypothetical protein